MVDLPRHAPLGHLLVRLAKTHRQWVSDALEELGLYVGQELLLAQLCQRDGIRQASLAEALGIEPATVHRTLVRLETAGFVRRGTDPSDNRVSLAYLTPKGRETCARIGQIWQEADQRLRAALAPEDAARLRGLLTELTDRLEHGQE